MIQRIQTFFLFAASALLFSLFFCNFIYTDAQPIKYMEYTPFIVLAAVSFAVSFSGIFLFRKRVLQMRFCIYDIIILIAFQIWIGYLFFPIIASILVYLAFRYIEKDELLVRSSNSFRDISREMKKKK
jgi:hypothetical protein